MLNLRAGDVALNRLDVSAQLDGVEEGLWIVNQLEAQGVRVLNRPPALLAAHDKLITARLLSGAGIPHPRTRRLHFEVSLEQLSLPIVAKLRFGSWGRDVELCGDRRALDRYMRRMVKRPWWRAGGGVLALAATRRLGIDLGGVDLLRDDDGWVVLEVNGAVDMKAHYALDGTDVFGAALSGLQRVAAKPLLASQW